jgi:hypothetical protein
MPVQVDAVQNSRGFPRVQVSKRARELLVRVVTISASQLLPSTDADLLYVAAAPRISRSA